MGFIRNKGTCGSTVGIDVQIILDIQTDTLAAGLGAAFRNFQTVTGFTCPQFSTEFFSTVFSYPNSCTAQKQRCRYGIPPEYCRPG